MTPCSSPTSAAVEFFAFDNRDPAVQPSVVFQSAAASADRNVMDALTARLVADTERELERLAASGVDDLLPEFLLLSLEREQVAAIAYSEDLLVHRLEALDVSPEIAELLRRVTLWVQRDEELHAQYLRGLLVRTQKSVPLLFVFMRQVYGGVSGWVSAMRHHRPPGRFGVRNLLAAGALLGGIRSSRRGLR